MVGCEINNNIFIKNIRGGKAHDFLNIPVREKALLLCDCFKDRKKTKGPDWLPKQNFDCAIQKR